MKRWTVLATVAMMMVLAGTWTSTTFSQQGRGGGGQGGFDRAEFQARMDEMMKERLGASNEEWGVLQPRIRKVQDYGFGGRGAGMGRAFGFGGRGGQGRGPAVNPDAPATVQAVAAATEKLGDLVERDAPANEIKTALEQLREARKSNDAAHKQAQQELREVVTLKQEALLVMMAMLD